MAQFNVGQIVYTPRGQRAEYVSNVDGKHVVKLGTMIEEEGEEVEFFDDLMIVPKVFSSAPVESIDAKIIERETYLAELDAKVAAAYPKIDAAKKEEADLKKRLGMIAALRRIDDVVAGKFTHFVRTNYDGVYIETKDEALKSRGERIERLMVLFGQSGGNLQWRVNEYYDGSGSWRDMIPCFSEEDARQRAAEIWEGRVEVWRNKPSDFGYMHYWVPKIDIIGLPVPDDVRSALKEANRNNLQAQVDDAEKKAAEARANLAALS